MYTTVKVEKELAKKLKILAIKGNVNLQELINEILIEGLKLLKESKKNTNK